MGAFSTTDDDASLPSGLEFTPPPSLLLGFSDTNRAGGEGVAVPRGITLQDVRDAAARLDRGEPHDFGEPTRYVAIVEGRTYAPKALIGLAARRTIGRDLRSDEFSSGPGSTQAVGFLRSLGITVERIQAPGAPAAWLFQGNPDHFDIDGYLEATKSIWWLVKRHGDQMHAGQTVYLWRNRGHDGATAGVVAVGIIKGSPEVRLGDPAAQKFWKQPENAENPAARVPIDIIDVAPGKGLIKSEWLKEDPICADLPNLRMRQGTNYPLEAKHAERLARLWFKTGQNFERLDLLLSLRAYVETFGGPVSKLPGSPIAKAAIATGRAITSIYSKVMNFRALDPRVPGEGQQNGGASTAAVWSEFWTGTTIDVLRLGAAIDADGSPGSSPASLGHLEAEAAELDPTFSAEGRRRLVTHMKIERNRHFVAEVKARWFVADPLLRCLVCSMSFKETYGSLGEKYIEAHHLRPLAELDGPTPPKAEDLAPVCANCHRMLHRGPKVSLEDLRETVLRSRPPR